MDDKVKEFKPNKYAREKVGTRKYINASITDPDWWELKSVSYTHLTLPTKRIV